MAKKTKKPLLNEGTVRRMLQLADMESIGTGFLSETYTQIEEEQPLDEQEEEIEDVEVAPELPGDEGPEELAPEEGAEVTITDEEAQDIIDLADKLRDAVGDEAPEEMPPEPEMELGAEEEEAIEEPGNRGMYEENEELYEAALKGLNIDIADDKAAQAEAVLKEIKSRVYKRVVSRLLKENKKK